MRSSTVASPATVATILRSRLLSPLVITILFLIACAAGSLIWTALYINSIVSGIERGRPATSAGRRTNGAPPRAVAPASGAAVPAVLLAEVHGAVWAVHTLDANGEPVTGSAFAVISTSSQTYLLASFSVVAAATYQPAPTIEVSQGNGAPQATTLLTWDPAHDLALLDMTEGNEPVLHGTGAYQPRPGQPIYVVSGWGGSDGSITAGKISNASSSALEYDAPKGVSSDGGPLIDATGSVLGVDSSAYTPSQATDSPAGTSSAVPIQEACAQVLACPGGSFPSS